MEMLTHYIIVFMANMFALLPDGAALSLFGDHLTLNGDGSFITSAELSAQLYN